jgi:DNA-binding response OmpR family regulator
VRQQGSTCFFLKRSPLEEAGCEAPSSPHRSECELKVLALAGESSYEFGMGKKVLFVDDDDNWRSKVSSSLKGAGHEVLAAKDATQAMLQAEDAKLGLIILDLDLGGEDGLMLMKFLKRNHPGVPIILFSDTEHDEEAIKAMLLQGAHQYLRKGSTEELIKAVRRSFR